MNEIRVAGNRKDEKTVADDVVHIPQDQKPASFNLVKIGESGGAST